MKKTGFTIVELLVVVGIIAIVVAITFPVFSAARENARISKCISNLHQLGLAVTMYRQEWDGIDPSQGFHIATLTQVGFPPLSMRKEFLHAYKLDNTDVYYCPSSRPFANADKLPYMVQYTSLNGADDAILYAMNTRGMDFPLSGCLYHNSIPQLDLNATYATLRVPVVRLNQQAKVSMIKAYGQGGSPYW